MRRDCVAEIEIEIEAGREATRRFEMDVEEGGGNYLAVIFGRAGLEGEEIAGGDGSSRRDKAAGGAAGSLERGSRGTQRRGCERH